MSPSQSERFDVALFSEAIISQTKLFFANRDRTSSNVSRKPSHQPKLQEPSPDIGLINKVEEASGFQTNGVAILDTGASRSVIGEESLPVLLNQLPSTVRDRVKEKASRVAFRFGNNQIEHSFKQIHIPIEYRRTRMWIVIEVVPKATPFLLSIQTLKQLRAVIDLMHSSCHLKSLNKAIPLHAARTGLLMIRMQDLGT